VTSGYDEVDEANGSWLHTSGRPGTSWTARKEITKEKERGYYQLYLSCKTNEANLSLAALERCVNQSINQSIFRVA